MPPLITREEALELGEVEDHARIEALIERAWHARLERPCPCVTMQKRCAPAASAARACSSTCSGSIIACIGVSASAKRDWAQKPQSSAHPPDLAFTSEHMSVESANRSTRTRQARSTSSPISACDSMSPRRSASVRLISGGMAWKIGSPPDG